MTSGQAASVRYLRPTVAELVVAVDHEEGQQLVTVLDVAVAVPAPVLRGMGLVSREMRELAETSYMFTRPFVLDSTASEQRLGLSPTTTETGTKETVAWWREHQAASR